MVAHDRENAAESRLAVTKSSKGEQESRAKMATRVRGRAGSLTGRWQRLVGWCAVMSNTVCVLGAATSVLVLSGCDVWRLVENRLWGVACAGIVGFFGRDAGASCHGMQASHPGGV